MQVAAFRHLYESCYDIFHDFQNFLLGDPSFLLEEAAEIAFVAKLSDNVAMGSLADHVEALQDVGMLDLCQGLDLAI